MPVHRLEQAGFAKILMSMNLGVFLLVHFSACACGSPKHCKVMISIDISNRTGISGSIKLLSEQC